MTRSALVVVALAALSSRALADDAITYVAPTALMQTDFQGHPQDEEGDTGFSLARFRIGAWSLPAPWIFALAEAEFASGETPTILDAFVRLGPWHGLRALIGYAKSPLFPSYRNELEGMTPLPELSMSTRALTPGRDLGIELHYAPPRFPLEAFLRVSNGNSSPFENDNDSFSVSARLDATMGRGRIDPSGMEMFGLRVGVGALVDDSYDRAGTAGTTASGFQFYRPPTVSGTRRVVEAHALAYAGPVRFLAEVGAANEERHASVSGDPSAARPSRDPEISRGGAVEVAWMITGEKRVASVWPVARSKNPFAFDHPAIEIAARAERLDVGLGMRDVAPGGATGGAIAANAWLNAMLAVSVAGTIYRYDHGPIEEPTRLDSWLFQARLTLYLNPPPLGPAALVARPLLGLH